MFQTTVLQMWLVATAQIASAEMYYASFGGCVNRTHLAIVGVSPLPGVDPAFHCHMDSSHCLEGEEWLTSVAVESEGFGPCTCDEEYENNVFIAACYDMSGTHQVVCAYNETQCPTDWLVLSGSTGGRFGNENHVADECSHGSEAARAVNNTESCGKRCTCNYHYSMRTETLERGSSAYGICFSPTTDQKYCAVSSTACADGETFYGPHDGLERFNIDCGCDATIVGGCMKSDTEFSHCAVAADGCTDGQSFLSARQLVESDMDVDCRLCANTWEPENVVKMPIDGLVIVTATPETTPPTGSPTTNNDGATSAVDRPDGDSGAVSVPLYTVAAICVAVVSSII